MPLTLKSAPYNVPVYGTQNKSFYSKSQFFFIPSRTFACLSAKQTFDLASNQDQR